MSGRLIAVVGPSGVGKDSVMAGIAARASDLHLVRRVITRPVEAGGEVFTPATPDAFAVMAARGDFALSWAAHGLDYGIPSGVDAVLAEGRDALVNLSRGVLVQARARFGQLMVLSLSADPEVLAQRLRARGREAPEAIAGRLARKGADLPEGLNVFALDNSGPLEATVQRALTALYPEREYL